MLLPAVIALSDCIFSRNTLETAVAPLMRSPRHDAISRGCSGLHSISSLAAVKLLPRSRPSLAAQSFGVH